MQVEVFAITKKAARSNPLGLSRFKTFSIAHLCHLLKEQVSPWSQFQSLLMQLLEYQVTNILERFVMNKLIVSIGLSFCMFLCNPERIKYRLCGIYVLSSSSLLLQIYSATDKYTAVFMSKYISRHKSVVTVAFRVFLQSLNIIAAHAVDHSVFAGVPPSLK